MSQRLRSESAAIHRLAPLIGRAVEAGHAHRAIHESMTEGGLITSFTNYRVALGRARKTLRSAPSISSRATLPPVDALVHAEGMDGAHPALPHVPNVMHSLAQAAQPAAAAIPGEIAAPPASNLAPCSATRVMDSLAEARKAPATRDYAQIAREQFRAKQRDARDKQRARHNADTPGNPDDNPSHRPKEGP